MKKLFSLAVFFILLISLSSPQPAYSACGRINRGGPSSGSCTVPGGVVCSGSPDTCCTTSQECGDISTYVPSGNGTGIFSQNVNKFNSEGIGLVNRDLWTVNGIIGAFLPVIMTLGGLVLFIMLILGGVTMMTGVGNPKAAENGKQQITTAIIGFFTLFASYWIIQILEIVLGVSILGS